MKKIAMMMVAAAAVAFAVPASAQTIVIKKGGVHRNYDRGYHARAEWRHRDHGWRHRQHNRGPAIVIQR